MGRRRSPPLRARRAAAEDQHSWRRLKLRDITRRDRDTQLVAAGWLAVRIWEHEDPVEAAGAIEPCATGDNRILWGGYDAIYHYGARLCAELDQRPSTFTALAENFFRTFPQLDGIRFTHTWGGPIDTCSRFCAFFGTAARGQVAYALGFTGLGVGATRFAAQVMLDRLQGLQTTRTELGMVRTKPLPFPPEPIRWLGVQLTRRSLGRADRNGGKRNLWLHTMDALGFGFDS